MSNEKVVFEFVKERNLEFSDKDLIVCVPSIGNASQLSADLLMNNAEKLKMGVVRVGYIATNLVLPICAMENGQLVTGCEIFYMKGSNICFVMVRGIVIYRKHFFKAITRELKPLFQRVIYSFGVSQGYSRDQNQMQLKVLNLKSVDDKRNQILKAMTLNDEDVDIFRENSPILKYVEEEPCIICPCYEGDNTSHAFMMAKFLLTLFFGIDSQSIQLSKPSSWAFYGSESDPSLYV